MSQQNGEIDLAQVLKDCSERMDKTVVNFKSSLAGLRTGRVSAALLDPVRVEAYNDMMPLNQVATVTAADAQLLLVQVWDRDVAKAVDKAIRESGLGLNPMCEGQTIRVPIPPLTQERKVEMAKKVKEYLENARISIRNVRQDTMTKIKDSEKKKLISEDAMKEYTEKVQKLTDDHIKNAESIAKNKSDEIMS